MKLCEFLRLYKFFNFFSDWSKDCDRGNIIYIVVFVAVAMYFLKSFCMNVGRVGA